MICINCGKEFETNDKRVKRCDECRKPKEKKSPEELLKRLSESSDRLQSALARARRKALIRLYIHLAVHIAEIVSIIVLFVLK